MGTDQTPAAGWSSKAHGAFRKVGVSVTAHACTKKRDIWERQMTVRTVLLALCLLLGNELQTEAKGSAVNGDTPWNAHHIDVLPVEVRHYIAEICKGPPRANHDFATYNPQEKRWRINLEYLQCNGHGLAEYRHGNQCLDIDFIAVGSHWQHARKTYADCGF
jgi:hypothetical protein